MPAWNTHIEIGKRMGKKLGFSGRKMELFLLGNLLPDINNGYINQVKTRKKHKDTHWAFNEKSSLNFYAKYRNEIEAREPMYMGYLLHLYTDGYFNYDFHRKFSRTGAGRQMDREERQGVKHNDFRIFEAKYQENQIEVNDREEVAKLANRIEGVEINAEDILEVETVLNDDELLLAMKDRPYIFYTEERLEELMEEMMESFTRKYIEEVERKDA